MILELFVESSGGGITSNGFAGRGVVVDWGWGVTFGDGDGVTGGVGLGDGLTGGGVTGIGAGG